MGQHNDPEPRTIRGQENPQTLSEKSHDTLFEPNMKNSGSSEGAAFFRDYRIIGPVSSRGAEADLYLISKDKNTYVLKLYRSSVAPVQEILNMIMQLSRQNPKHLVPIFEAGFDETSGRWYEIMEYISMGALQDVNLDGVNRKPLVLAMVQEIAEPIWLLHQHEIVHCDIKPSNILIRSVNPFNLVLTDFGIASQVASDISLKMTTLKGTPLYWAPEAFSSLVAPASDWWSLGVIALEYLTGSHPFAGLVQQQITYQLTTKGIEIPEYIGEESQLLKGLLTKDIARRWGYTEITRWFAGDRDIPVYYEEPLTSAHIARGKSGGSAPFFFEGMELYSLEAIAAAFAKDENSWKLGLQYFDYLYQWLESNRYLEKAVRIKNALKHNEDPNVILFHFIHSSANLPFIYLGKKIDIPHLAEYFKRDASFSASPEENAIVRAMDNGQLLELSLAYHRYNTISEDSINRLLNLLINVTSDQRADYAGAVAYPENYLWPRFSEATEPDNPIDMLEELGRPPIEKSILNQIRSRYALPQPLTNLLNKSDSYNNGILKIRQLNQKKLLISFADAHLSAIPMDPQGDVLMGLEEYTVLAKKMNWGFDGTLKNNASYIQTSLNTIVKNSGGRLDIQRILHRLQDINNKPITPNDRRFITDTVSCMERHHPTEETVTSFVYQYIPIISMTCISLIYALYPMSALSSLESMIYFFLFYPCLRKSFKHSSFSTIEESFLSAIRLFRYCLPALLLLGGRIWFLGLKPLTPELLFYKTQVPLLKSALIFLVKYSNVVFIIKYTLLALFNVWFVLYWRRHCKTKKQANLSSSVTQLNDICFKTMDVKITFSDSDISENNEDLSGEFQL